MAVCQISWHLTALQSSVSTQLYGFRTPAPIVHCTPKQKSTLDLLITELSHSHGLIPGPTDSDREWVNQDFIQNYFLQHFGVLLSVLL